MKNLQSTKEKDDIRNEVEHGKVTKETKEKEPDKTKRLKYSENGKQNSKYYSKSKYFKVLEQAVFYPNKLRVGMDSDVNITITIINIKIGNRGRRERNRLQRRRTEIQINRTRCRNYTHGI